MQSRVSASCPGGTPLKTLFERKDRRDYSVSFFCATETVYAEGFFDVGECVRKKVEFCYLSKSMRTLFSDPSEQALIFDENFPIKKFYV